MKTTGENLPGKHKQKEDDDTEWRMQEEVFVVLSLVISYLLIIPPVCVRYNHGKDLINKYRLKTKPGEKWEEKL